MDNTQPTTEQSGVEAARSEVASTSAEAMASAAMIAWGAQERPAMRYLKPPANGRDPPDGSAGSAALEREIREYKRITKRATDELTGGRISKECEALLEGHERCGGPAAVEDLCDRLNLALKERGSQYRLNADQMIIRPSGRPYLRVRVGIPSQGVSDAYDVPLTER